MVGRWIGSLVLASAAVVVAGTMATAVGATQSTPPATTSVSYDVAHQSAPPAVNRAVSDTLTQTIRLEIRGGDLTIEPSSLVVELAAHGDVLRGELPDITVIDARGTLRGWTARVRMVSVAGVDAEGTTRRVPPGQVVLTPRAPSLIDGSLDGIVAGRTGRGRGFGTLLRAAKDAGGGTFVGGGTIEIVRTNGLVEATATIDLSVS